MYQSLSFPDKITFNKSKRPHTKELVIEPCFPGYGTTLANALRRVLLSSLSGGAIIAVKIKDASHEFSTLPYIKEDMLEIILNLKKIKFNIHGDSNEHIKVTLKVQGEKEVTAKDIKTTSDVEVANPEAIIAHLTDKAAELEMELFVKNGMGYSSTESRADEKLDLGTVSIDATFTPIVSVGFRVDNVRVGEYTNYDKIVMEVETDGTVTPEEAVKESAQILITHFQLITGEKQPKINSEADEPVAEMPDEVKGEKE